MTTLDLNQSMLDRLIDLFNFHYKWGGIHAVSVQVHPSVEVKVTDSQGDGRTYISNPTLVFLVDSIEFNNDPVLRYEVTKRVSKYMTSEAAIVEAAIQRLETFGTLESQP